MQIKFAIWVLRVVWLIQPLTFGPMLGDATSTLTDFGRILLTAAAWLLWAAGLLATFVPSTVSTTVGRLLAPTALAAAVSCSLFGSVDGWKIAVGIGGSVLGLLAWFSGEVGLALAQGSAYGDEQRFPLKPPVPYLAPMAVSWIVLAATSLGGLGLLANEQWLIGALLIVVAVVVGWFVGPRFHQLSRRWLVVVPVGLVLHDPLLMAENSLFRAPTLRAVHLAPAGTDAADLTGGTAGVAIEVVFTEMQNVIKAGGRANPRGIALHALSVLVSPSRPGHALAAAARRNFPVG